MAPDFSVRDVRAALAAAAIAGTGITAAALYAIPDVFAPWPLFLAALVCAGIGGAVAALAIGGGYVFFPTIVFLLPIYRLALLFMRHGPPPWPTRAWSWLTGDGFPWWAGCSLAAAGYAGTLAFRYARISRCLSSLRRGRLEDYRALRSGAEGDLTQLDYEAVSRLCLGPVIVGAILFAVFGPARESLPVLVCAASFIVLGFHLTGLTYARRLAVLWAAQGIDTPSGVEEKWWAGHGRFLWILLAFLPFLPGGFRPLRLSAILAWLSGSPPRLADLGELADKPGLEQIPNLTHVAPGFFGRVLMVMVLLMYGALALGAAAASLCACYFCLRGLVHRLAGWLKAIGPFWRGMGRFLALLRKIFLGAATMGTRLLRWTAGGRTLTGRPGRSPRRAWPSSRIRMLFARLVIWGRARGLDLKPSYTPGQLGRDLGALVPGREEDLAYIVEVYQRERYGEMRATPLEQRLYHQAWARTIGGANRPDVAVREPAAKGEGE